VTYDDRDIDKLDIGRRTPLKSVVFNDDSAGIGSKPSPKFADEKRCGQ